MCIFGNDSAFIACNLDEQLQNPQSFHNFLFLWLNLKLCLEKYFRIEASTKKWVQDGLIDVKFRID